MARIRSIKPEIWGSPQVMNLKHSARLMFIGLITQADDEGRGSADPRKLRGTIFPGDDEITVAKIGELLTEIEHEKLVVLYKDDDGLPLFALTGWRRNQSIDKARASNYPPPSNGQNGHTLGPSSSLPRTLPDKSRALDEQSSRTRVGSDLKDLNGSEGSLRARASEPYGLARRKKPEKTQTELESDSRRLALAGMSAADIAHALGQYGVTAAQVTTWLTNAPATAPPAATAVAPS